MLTNNLLENIVDLLRKLSSAPVLTSDLVENLLEVPFSPPEDLPGGYRMWRYSDKSSVWRIVEFRRGERDDEEIILSFSPNPSISISHRDFTRRVPSCSHPVGVNPDVPPEGEVYFEVNEKHQTNTFAFRHRSDTLADIIVRRPSHGETAHVVSPWGAASNTPHEPTR